MSDTTTFDYTGPLSKRAIQILRELQGGRLFEADAKASPPSGGQAFNPQASANFRAQAGGQMGGYQAEAQGQDPQAMVSALAAAQVQGLAADPIQAPSATSSKKAKRRASKLINRFSRNLYLADTRSSYLASLVFAVFLLLVVLGAGLSATFGLVLPRLNASTSELEKLKALPNQLLQLQSQIQQRQSTLSTTTTSVTQVKSGLSDADDTLTAFSMFIARLAEENVQLISQKDTVNQAVGPHPLLPPPPAPAAAGARPTQAPVAQPAPAAVSAKLVPGINVRHVHVSLQGNYMGYLAARQTLLTLLPNAVIHKETLTAQGDDQSRVAIELHISLPFENQ